MKMLIPASFLFYSAVSLADYNCQELDSKLQIKELPFGKVNVELIYKDGTTAQKTFKGKQIESDSDTVYETKNFILTESMGPNANLKVSIVPSFPEFPRCTGRRMCLNETQLLEISAELDFQGKVTTYDCHQELP